MTLDKLSRPWKILWKDLISIMSTSTLFIGLEDSGVRTRLLCTYCGLSLKISRDKVLPEVLVFQTLMCNWWPISYAMPKLNQLLIKLSLILCAFNLNSFSSCKKTTLFLLRILLSPVQARVYPKNWLAMNSSMNLRKSIMLKSLKLCSTTVSAVVAWFFQDLESLITKKRIWMCSTLD